MKMKQACRFRMESGYRICAKSPDLTVRDEESVSSVLNDSMNNLFDSMGQSIYVCSQSGGDALIGLSTMSSDILSRRSIFSHALVVDKDIYCQAIEKMPELILRIQRRDFLTAVPRPDMENVEISEDPGDDLSLDALREKYALDTGRFAMLLCGAYQGVIEDRLCLGTSLPLEETPQLVAEIAYCISKALLPSLRGNLSFSSAADPRMAICVSHSGKGQLFRDALYFPVNVPGSIQVNWENLLEKEQNFFLSLARCPADQLENLLQDIQSILLRMKFDPQSCSIGQISSAFYLRENPVVESMDPQLAAELAGELMAGTATVVSDDMDIVLSRLLTVLIREKLWRSELLVPSLERFLQGGEKVFDDAAKEYIKLAPDSEAAQLLAIVLRLPYEGDPQVTDTITILLHQIDGQQNRVMTAQLAEQLADWVIEHDWPEGCDYVQRILCSGLFSQDRRNARACSIIAKLEERPLRKTEKSILAELLNSTDASVESSLFDSRTLHLLDRYILKKEDPLFQAIVDYNVYVRLYDGRDLSSNLNEMRMIKNNRPDLFRAILGTMEQIDDYADLLVAYHATEKLDPSMDLEELKRVCAEHNKTLDPNSIFEKRAREILTSRMGADLERNLKNAPFDSGVQMTLAMTDEVLNFHLSEKSQSDVEYRIVTYFWHFMSPERLRGCDFVVPDVLNMELPSFTEQARKARKVFLMLKTIYDDDNHRVSRNVIRTAESDDSVIPYLRELALLLSENKSFISWDLILLASTTVDEKGESSILPDEIVEIVGKMHITKNDLKNIRSTVEDSVLLEDSGTQKFIKKALSKSNQPLVQALIQEMDSGRKSLLGSIGGVFGLSKSKESKEPATDSAARRKKDQPEPGYLGFDPIMKKDDRKSPPAHTDVGTDLATGRRSDGRQSQTDFDFEDIDSGTRMIDDRPRHEKKGKGKHGK